MAFRYFLFLFLFLQLLRFLEASQFDHHYVTNAKKRIFGEPWNNWKRFYGKTYPQMEVEDRKMAIWIENFQNVHNHNSMYHIRPTTYTQTLNEFADIPFYVFQTQMLGSATYIGDPRGFYRKDLVKAIDELPDNFSWLDKGAVTAVKHQGKCGNGWAFASVGTHEGNFFLEQGELKNLSTKQLLDCSDSSSSCLYGSTLIALHYIKIHGLTTEEQYPYEAKKTRCGVDPSMTVTENNSYKTLVTQTEIDLKIELFRSGPIAVNIHVNPNFVFYRQGVYYDPECLESSTTNHALLLVGYGEDPELGDYWLVKNSWGVAWGMGGYAKIARNTKFNCGIAKSASVPIRSRK